MRLVLSKPHVSWPQVCRLYSLLAGMFLCAFICHGEAQEGRNKQLQFHWPDYSVPPDPQGPAFRRHSPGSPRWWPQHGDPDLAEMDCWVQSMGASPVLGARPYSLSLMARALSKSSFCLLMFPRRSYLSHARNEGPALLRIYTTARPWRTHCQGWRAWSPHRSDLAQTRAPGMTNKANM